MSTRRMSTLNKSDVEKKPKYKTTDKIPVFGIAGAKRNKNLLKLKQDLEERGRSNEGASEEPKVEMMYVDATRNVGVVLGKRYMVHFGFDLLFDYTIGENDISKDMKKQAYLDKRSVFIHRQFIK